MALSIPKAAIVVCRHVVATFTLAAFLGGCIPEPTAPPATHILFVKQPPTAAWSLVSLGSVSVAFLDDDNHVVTSARGVVLLSLAGSDTSAHLLRASQATAVNGVATFTGLGVDKAGSDYRLVAKVAGYDSTLSALFTISPAPEGTIGSLVFVDSVASVQIAGRTIAGVGVLVTDLSGTTDTTSSTAITITLLAGNLLGTTTRNAVKGMAMFPDVSAITAGDSRLVATAANRAPGVSNWFHVRTGSLSALTLYGVPLSVTVGEEFGLGVALRDAFGNIVRSDDGLAPQVPVTISLGESPTGATLAGTLTRETNFGYTYFVLAVDKPGTYRLVATSPGFRTDTSVAFTAER